MLHLESHAKITVCKFMIAWPGLVHTNRVCRKRIIDSKWREGGSAFHQHSSNALKTDITSNYSLIDPQKNDDSKLWLVHQNPPTPLSSVVRHTHTWARQPALTTPGDTSRQCCKTKQIGTKLSRPHQGEAVLGELQSNSNSYRQDHCTRGIPFRW